MKPGLVVSSSHYHLLPKVTSILTFITKSNFIWFGTSYKWNDTAYVLLYDFQVYFFAILPMLLYIAVCSFSLLCSFLLYDYIQFISPFSCWYAFGFFRFGATMTNFSIFGQTQHSFLLCGSQEWNCLAIVCKYLFSVSRSYQMFSKVVILFDSLTNEV